MEQMVAGMSALINGGNYYEPHVVKQIQDENGNVIETKESVLKKRNVTMEQMVAGMSALINGGNYYEPHVVKQIQDENGNVIETKESVLKKRVISEQTSTMLKQY